VVAFDKFKCLGQKQHEQSQRYQISGKIEGLKNRKVFLKSYFHEKEIIDSVFSKDGVFRFQGKWHILKLYPISQSHD
jgi:hypothetical protein